MADESREAAGADTGSARPDASATVDDAAEGSQSVDGEAGVGAGSNGEGDASTLAVDDSTTALLLEANHGEVIAYLDYVNTGLLVNNLLVAVLIGMTVFRFFSDRLR